MNFFKKVKDKHHDDLPVSSGEIMLGFGQHEIKVTMHHHPSNVGLSIQDPCDGCPVCHGGINKIGVTILNNGFVLYADIKTNTACVQWFCESTA